MSAFRRLVGALPLGSYEEDFLALLPAGASGASMASDHCLRGQVKDRVL